jgi:hypothetical protein
VGAELYEEVLGPSRKQFPAPQLLAKCAEYKTYKASRMTLLNAVPGRGRVQLLLPFLTVFGIKKPFGLLKGEICVETLFPGRYQFPNMSLY